MNKVKICQEKKRFELVVDKDFAFIEFDKIESNVVGLTHPEVPESHSGKGVGSKLVSGALRFCKENGLKIIPSCSFVRSFIDKHPKWQELVSKI